MTQGPSSDQGRSEDEPQVTFEPEWEALFNAIIGEGVKTRQAVEVGTKAVEYFRGEDLVRWVKKQKKRLLSQHSKIFKNLEEIEPQSVGQALISKGFVLRAIHRPVGVVLEGEGVNGADDSRSQQIVKENAKWPRRLQITPKNQTFDDQSFYIIVYNPPTKWNYLYLSLLLLGVFVVCLFPIWPFRLKVATWYIGVVFTTLMIILIIVRLVLFAALWFGGCDFWLLPNLFNEDAGFIDSFIPGYTFEKRKDDWLMIAARIFCATISVFGFYKLGETHSLSDMSGFASKQFLDIIEWGHKKLGEAPANPEMQAAKNQLSEETPEERTNRVWESCVKYCDFDSRLEFEELCSDDCECMDELIGSKCWRKCDAEIITELNRLKSDCHQSEEAVAEDDEEVDGMHDDEL